MTDTTAPRTAAPRTETGTRLVGHHIYLTRADVLDIEREAIEPLLVLVRAAQELAHAWTIPEYPHPGLREDALIDALAALPESVRVAARKPEPFDEADNMCPNCVTPWKCNGPHLAEETVAARKR